jgi:hypothetical protein
MSDPSLVRLGPATNWRQVADAVPAAERARTRSMLSSESW